MQIRVSATLKPNETGDAVRTSLPADTRVLFLDEIEFVLIYSGLVLFPVYMLASNVFIYCAVLPVLLLFNRALGKAISHIFVYLFWQRSNSVSYLFTDDSVQICVADQNEVIDWDEMQEYREGELTFVLYKRDLSLMPVSKENVAKVIPPQRFIEFLDLKLKRTKRDVF